MWLIPGKTKVKMEIFKGVGIVDILIGVVSAVLLVFLLISNLPHKMIFSLILVLVVAFLLIRIDDEPNYIFVLHIIRYLGYPRHYLKSKDGQPIFYDFSEAEEEEKDDPFTETAQERKERIKREKEEYREESKRLRAKGLTKEEEDAIWLKRANRSAANSQRKRAKSAKTHYKEMDRICAFTGIHDGYIEYDGKYYGMVIEISPVEFRFFSATRKYMSINNGIGKILRSVNPEFAANIVKIDRPVHYEKYLEAEKEKLDSLRRAFEKGMMREDELKARVEVVYERMLSIEKMMEEEKVVVPFYYLVLFDSDRNQLNNQVHYAISSLENAELPAKLLNSAEVAAFLKYTNALDVKESELDHMEESEYAKWARPDDLMFRVRTTEVNHVITHTLRVVTYPSMADDAWLATVMSMPGTKCVVKAKPMDMEKAIRGIDRSLSELRSRYSATSVDSKLIELQSHIDSLSNLLSMIQGGNESLLEVNVYVTAYDIMASEKDMKLEEPKNSILPRITNMKKMIRRLYRENNLRLTGLDFEQIQGFIATQVSGYDPFASQGRGMPANSVSAGYPWVFASVSDVGGIQLGAQDGVPVFIDFFRRDSERVNSNMVIVGKSGSGKSFATKALLTNLAADDSKIFILDPENEYTELAANLHGKFINVGNAQQGRLNPFHIMTSEADEDSDDSEVSVSGSYATHLQFLEEFFKQIIPDCDKDAMEYLNSIVDRMYSNKGIFEDTDFTKLAPEDFPVFDDLYDAILQEFQQTDNEYIRTMLRTLMNYVNKFSAGGRNANIWNGPSTVTTDENFSVFNFQSLLTNRNATIANAQMLLVLKYIDNEIIKNRDYNTRNHMNRKVIVVIDEAHVFIDEKYPVALDFMYQLAKRIRKYNGMQIVITQNIKDFVGTEELARKSTAIINACQYSFIFPLAPNDMNDLCKLYEKAGGINESEQEGIVQAPRGQAFTILSTVSRSSFKVEVPSNVRDMFEYPDYESEFFTDDENDSVWMDYLGEGTREKHNLAVAERFYQKELERSAGYERRSVLFEEISEDEYTGQNEEEAQNDGEVTLLQEENTVQTENAGRRDVESAAADQAAPEYMQSFARVFEENANMNKRILMQMSEKDQTSQRTEELLTRLIEQMSNDSLNRSIRDTIEREVEKRVAQAMGNRADGSYSSGRSEETAEHEPVTNEMSMGDSLLGSLFAAGDSGDSFDEDDGGFDIMSLLAAEAERMSSVSPISQMELYDEEVIDITLDDLNSYIRNLAEKSVG